MNLFEALKQFKNIEPDPASAERTKRAVLASPQNNPVSVRKVIFRIFETSSALVLGGFLILLLTGALPVAHNIAPVQLSVVDPASIRAEAEAIDMQIQLANLNYAEVAPQASTPQSATLMSPKPMSNASVMSETSSTSTSSPSTSSSSASSTASSSVSIDQALQELSQ
jgi:hypothetical protein